MDYHLPYWIIFRCVGEMFFSALQSTFTHNRRRERELNPCITLERERAYLCSLLSRNVLVLFREKGYLFLFCPTFPICLCDWKWASDFHQSSIKWNIGCGAASDWNSLNFNCVFNLTYSCGEEWHHNAEGRSIRLISPSGIDEYIRAVDWKPIKTQWLGC